MTDCHQCNAEIGRNALIFATLWHRLRRGHWSNEGVRLWWASRPMLLRVIEYLLIAVIVTAILLIGRQTFAYNDITNIEFVECVDADTCRFIVIPREVQPDVPDLFWSMTVRFRGVDTPEMHGKCEAESRKARKALMWMEQVLRQATTIMLTKVHWDKYPRINAYVVADGLNLSTWLIDQGLAVEYWGVGPKKDWCR